MFEENTAQEKFLISTALQRKEEEKVVTIHSINGDFPVLHKQDPLKYRTYSARACLLSARTVIIPELSEESKIWLEDLQKMEIGPSKIIQVKPTSNIETLYEMIVRSPILRPQELVEVFMHSEAAAEFAKRANVVIKGPTQELVALANNKKSMREVFKNEELFPPFYLPKDVQDCMIACSAFSKRGPYVIKFKSESASTDGMRFFKKGQMPTSEMLHSEYSEEVIIDQFIEGVPFSLAYSIADAEINRIGISIQFFEGVPIDEIITIDHMCCPKSGSHCGNIIGPQGDNLNGFVVQDQEKAYQEAMIIPHTLHKMGYRGDLVVDCIWCPKTKRTWALEVNARTTFTTILRSIKSQVDGRLCRDLFYCGGFVHPVGIANYQELRGRISDFFTVHQAIPYQVELLPQKVGIICHSGSYVDAINCFKTVKKIIES